jgi:SPP1 family phage portal protein
MGVIKKMMSLEVAKQYVDDFLKSDFRHQMTRGVLYFRTKNIKIMSRKKMFAGANGKGIEDPFKANNKLPSAYMSLLVKQKVGYSVNEMIKIDNDPDDRIEDTLTKAWKIKLKKLCTQTSQKGVGYWQFYILNGQLKYKIIPAEQVVVVPSIIDNDIIAYVIRFYTETVTDDKGKVVEIQKAEIWDNQTVTYYRSTDDEAWQLDKDYEYNPLPHISQTIKYGESVDKIVGTGWGRPPFARLWNNDERMTDLQPIEEFIDIYDVVNSDFANNLEDFQDVYWVLKNYGGENLEEVLEQIKAYRVLATPENGDAAAHTIDIPAQARQIMLDNTEKLIYKFGQGLNPDDVEGNVTNVRIKALYAGLDLKANDFEIEIQDFWQQVMYFLNRYFELIGQPPVESELVFNRKTTMNEGEMLTANVAQVGFVSERTRLSNHPWVKDVDEELDQMQEESGEVVIRDSDIPAPGIEESLEDYADRVIGILIQEGYSQEEAIEIITDNFNKFSG